jgi:general nucleoside transport system permease protein
MNINALKNHWIRMSHTPRWVQEGLVTFGALLIALAILLFFLYGVGRDPFLTFGSIVSGGFGSVQGLTETLTRMTPLLLCALAAAIPAKAGLFNIGGEGQLHAGAIAATSVLIYLAWLPHWAVVPAMIVLAALGGMAWGLIPGILRGWLNVSEVLVSLMLNYVAIALVEHLVHGAWKDPSALGWPYSISFPQWAILPTIGQTNVHLVVFLGIGAIGLIHLLLRRTTWGFSIRVIEANPKTASYARIHVVYYIVILMAVGGAMAALAGLGEVSVIQGRLKPGISPGYGYTGFLVAWLARNNLIAIIPVAFIVGGFYSGADTLQLLAGLPSSTVDIFMSLVFFAFLVNEFIRRRYRAVVERSALS